jgi:hypothetical protein
MSQPRDEGSDVVSASITVVPPDHPPTLTPRAARALLNLLTSVHNMPSAAEQQELRWDRTG